MSIKYLSAAFDARIGSPGLKLTLLSLCRSASDSGLVSLPHALIARNTEQSRRTVIRHIDHLNKSGLLLDTGERSGRTKQVKVFRISLVRLVELGSDIAGIGA